MKTITRLLIGGAIVAILVSCLSRPSQAAPASTCPVMHCYTGSFIWKADPVPHLIPYVWTDGYGAPMFWLSVGGAISGGVPVCTVDATPQMNLTACLGGPSGKDAAPAITLYDHGKPFSMDLRQWEYLLSWLERRGVR